MSYVVKLKGLNLSNSVLGPIYLNKTIKAIYRMLKSTQLSYQKLWKDL